MQDDLSISANGTASFAARHVGPSAEDQRAMLATLGYASLDELLTAALPAYARPPASLSALPSPRTEQEVLEDLRRLAARNTVAVSMIGLGYYGTITPAVIRRNVLENPAWYTAYTPYQPEISQGRLEALLNFQTMIEDLTLGARRGQGGERRRRPRVGGKRRRHEVIGRGVAESGEHGPLVFL